MASISGLPKDFQGTSSTRASVKSGAAAGKDTAPKPPKADAALGSAVIVELSAQAKALTTAGVSPQLFKTPEEDIQQRTEALAGKLNDVLKRAGIPADRPYR